MLIFPNFCVSHLPFTSFFLISWIFWVHRLPEQPKKEACWLRNLTFSSTVSYFMSFDVTWVSIFRVFLCCWLLHQVCEGGRYCLVFRSPNIFHIATNIETTVSYWFFTVFFQIFFILYTLICFPIFISNRCYFA